MPDNDSGLVSRWLRWKDTTVSRKIFNATLLILILDVLGRLVSVVKELAVASYFGTGDVLDAFLIAFIVPSFVINVIEGSLGMAVIPAYIRAREQQGRQYAQSLMSGIMCLSLAATLLVAVLLAAVGLRIMPWIAGGFSESKLRLTQNLYYLLIPTVFISGLSSIGSTILNAEEKFGLAAFTRAAVPLCIILMLIFLPGWGSYALAAGTGAGYLLECLIIAGGLRKQGVALLFRWTGLTAELRLVVSQYIPALFGTLLMCSSVLVDQAMAAMLPSGSVSALNYAVKVVSLPLSLAGTALGTAVIPFFSQMVARKQWQQIRHTMRRYLGIIFVGGSTVSMVLIVAGESLVRLLFERGSFTGADTAVVARVLTYYALQAPFYVANILVTRVISSLRANRVLMWASVFNVVVNVVLNYVLMQSMGVAGIALSTSITYFLSFTILLVCSLRLIKLTGE